MTSPESPASVLDEGRIAQAAQRLLAGGLVAFPTETVYGLGGDAENPQAIERIYAAKGRPSNHPVIVHVAPEADLLHWASSVPEAAQRLIDHFWPGPLTLILPRAEHIPAAVAGGQDTIGLRCPSHPVAQALLRAFAALKPSGQGGVAAPSANKFGQVSPTRAAHVRAEFPELGDDTLIILEGGASQVGIESTIIDLSRLEQGVGPVLLRPGHITAEQIAAVLGGPVGLPDAAAPRVSGSLKAHYAPRTPLRLVPGDALTAAVQQALQAGGSVALAVFQPTGLTHPGIVAEHQCAADPNTFARDLYHLLRMLDAFRAGQIIMQAPPDTPAWRAVCDRLGRAAAAFEG